MSRVAGLSVISGLVSCGPVPPPRAEHQAYSVLGADLGSRVTRATSAEVYLTGGFDVAAPLGSAAHEAIRARGQDLSSVQLYHLKDLVLSDSTYMPERRPLIWVTSTFGFKLKGADTPETWVFVKDAEPPCLKVWSNGVEVVRDLTRRGREEFVSLRLEVLPADN